MALNFPAISQATLAVCPRPQALVNLAAGRDLPPGMMAEARVYERAVFTSMASTPNDKLAVSNYVIAIENKNMLELFAVATRNAIQTAVTQSLSTALPHINAKIANAGVVAENGELVPVPNLAGEAPPEGFPATRYDVFHLDNREMMPLETFYSLPHNGTVRTRQIRLAKAVGILV